MRVHLDFETRSRVDLRTSGAWVYSTDPSTEVLCMAFAIDDDPVELIRFEDLHKKHGAFIYALVHNATLVAHNAFFEQVIYNNIMVKRYGWPEILADRWECTAAKASVIGIPRGLDKACKVLNTAHQKSQEGKYVMLKMCKLRKHTKSNKADWHETAEDFEILYAYCIDDVEAERALDKKLPPLTDIERKVWLLDQKINLTGVQIDIQAVEAAIVIAKSYERVLLKRLKEVTGGKLDSAAKVAQMVKWLNEEGIMVGDVKKSTIDMLLADTDIPEKVRKVLEIRRQLSKTSVKKFYAMRNATGEDNRLRDLLMYHAASTGRWGGKLVQLQNLPRGTISDTDECIEIIKNKDYGTFNMFYGQDALGALSSSIRGMIVAKPGHELVVSDYASIEARVLLWLAGDKDAVAKYEQGIDLYVDMAKTIYRKKDISKTERQLGKAAILGSGYGMGPDKFYATCLSWGMEIDRDLAESTIQAYRSKYRKVVEFWYATDAGVKTLIRRGSGAYINTAYPVEWTYNGKTLRCVLPSGRSLYYLRPIIKQVDSPWGRRDQVFYRGVDSKTKQFTNIKTYGGKLVENIVQAVARDIMAWSMLRLESRGYNVTMSVHDEIIAEEPVGKVDIKEFESIMCEKEDWYKGCPIAAEGWKGSRYRK